MLSLKKYTLSFCTLLLFALLNPCYGQSIPSGQVNQKSSSIRIPRPGTDSSGVYNYFILDNRIKGRPVPYYTWGGDTLSSVQQLQALCNGFRNHIGHTIQENIFAIRFRDCLSMRDYIPIAAQLESYSLLWDIDLRKNLIYVYHPSFFISPTPAQP